MPPVIVIAGHEINRADIGALLRDKDSIAALHLYTRFKRYGFPWPGNWYDQPACFFDMVETLDIEATKIKKVQKK